MDYIEYLREWEDNHMFVVHEEEKEYTDIKYFVEYSEDGEYWDYVDGHQVIGFAFDETHAIEKAKELFVKMSIGEFTEEEVDGWKWRAAKVIEETEYCGLPYYETGEFVYYS